MSNKQKLAAFKKELKALLKKYDASLDLMLDGDTHGIHNEGIGVSFLQPLEKGKHWQKFSDTYRIGSKGNYSFNSSDI